MNRPSLYGAFGDKHRLYLSTLERYRELGRSAVNVIYAHGASGCTHEFSVRPGYSLPAHATHEE